MKFIPFSYFGGAEFSGSWARGLTGLLSGNGYALEKANYPYTGEVDIPVTSSAAPTTPYEFQWFQDLSASVADTDAIQVGLPYWTSPVQDINTCSTWRLQATSTGPSDRFTNFTLCGESNQTTRNQGTGPFDFTIMAVDTPTITGFTSDTSITKVNERGYPTFQNIGDVYKAYNVRFTGKSSAIAGSDGAWFYYIDENGTIQNQYVAVNSTVDVITQNAASIMGFAPPLGIGFNLEQQILGYGNVAVTPYQYEGVLRKYYIQQQRAVSTQFADVWYSDITGSIKNVTFGTPATSESVYSTVVPCPRNAALFEISDITDWETYTLASSSLSSSICSETNTNTYYLGDTGSLAVGNTIYNNVFLTDAVDSKYFSVVGSEFYHLTDASGEITTSAYCDDRRDAIYDIASGSVMSFANQSLTPSTGATSLTASLNVEQHFVSGTFGGEQTLEVNCPATTSGSAEIIYNVPSFFSPTGSVSFLTAFYHNGNPLWSIAPAAEQRLVGDLIGNPGNDLYGIQVTNTTLKVYGGSNSVTLSSSPYNNPGWNIFQYSYFPDGSRYRVNYNINGSLSGSFLADIGAGAEIDKIQWNYNDEASSIDNKLANGSHFQVLEVALEARTTSSMDTLFTQYNRYGL